MFVPVMRVRAVLVGMFQCSVGMRVGVFGRPAFPGGMGVRVVAVMRVKVGVGQRVVRVGVGVLFAQQQRGGRAGQRERNAQPRAEAFAQPQAGKDRGDKRIHAEESPGP